MCVTRFVKIHFNTLLINGCYAWIRNEFSFFMVGDEKNSLSFAPKLVVLTRSFYQHLVV